ncbi:hypothetical protein WR25_06407 [Diploscapter pachys]|uniref:Uncharacterized protein n=1 Tax=Diploscapter pachys TaxID=2018661 RepID=A0A2A2LZ88_9BILA|nr:hypothetical protein WR25_06407 [Diploscapter pachys]
MICVGSLVVAIPIHVLEGCPPIYGLAIFGGIVWCIGNSLCFFIMNRLGLAPAALIWNTISCMSGWGAPRFGLFGLEPNVPKSVGLNYLGIATLIVGAVLAALFAGLCFGNMLTPITYIQTHPEIYPDASLRGLPYLLSFHLGAFFTGTIIYAVYCVLKRNEPVQPPQIAIASLLGGLSFGVGMIFFLLGMELLSQSISYPLIAMLPGLFVSLWSIFYFEEISGQRNYVILSTAYVFTLIGVGLVTLSKDVEIF